MTFGPASNGAPAAEDMLAASSWFHYLDACRAAIGNATTSDVHGPTSS
jgi:hypothetical protein